MDCRLSAVGRLFVNTVSNASVLQIGDNADGAELFSRVLAVQRTLATFGKNEFRYGSYALFERPLPVAPALPELAARFYSQAAPIEIGDIAITGASAASHVRIGCGGPETAESRIVNIRNALPGIKPRVEVDFE